METLNGIRENGPKEREERKDAFRRVIGVQLLDARAIPRIMRASERYFSLTIICTESARGVNLHAA